MRTPKTFTIDTNAVLDFEFNWSAWLGDQETISSVTVTASGVTIDSHTNDDTTVTVWLSHAVVPAASVTCHITTSDARQDDRTLKLEVTNR